MSDEKPREIDVAEKGTEAQLEEKPVWYRSTLFNAYVIGLVGFCAPGLWNAMNALGAGGAQEPYVINGANALVFGLMAIFCVLGATVANYIGLAWTLVLGAAGYPVYSAALYCNSKYNNQWFPLFGGAIDGISAGLFWAAEGAVAVGYPEPSKRGEYLNIWLVFRILGPLVGGAIVLALNTHVKVRGHVSVNTYTIFIALQCLAVPIALFLTKPEKVQRKDGSKVKVAPKVSLKQTLVDLGKTFRRKEVLLLLPVFASAYFNSYSSTYSTLYFGVRARALKGFVGNLPPLVGSFLMSRWLDYKGVSRRNRVRYGFGIVVAVHILAWVYSVVIIADYTTRDPAPVFDWSSPGYVRGFFVVILWSIAQQVLQNWLYYVMGSLSTDISELTRLTGILRGTESAAQAVAYGINSRKGINPWIPLGINIALLIIAVPPTWLVARNLQFQDELEETSTTAQVSDSSDSVADDSLQKVATRER